MAKAKATVSKNARVNRGSNIKIFTEHGGKLVEICAVKFYGLFLGLGNYIAVQKKDTKELLLDSNSVPISWNAAQKTYTN